MNTFIENTRIMNNQNLLGLNNTNINMKNQIIFGNDMNNM